MFRKSWHFIIFLLMIFSCKKESSRSYAFYFWKSDINLTEAEQKILSQSSSKELYMRLFDIDKTNGEIKLLGTLETIQKKAFEKKIVPVIFLTNRCWIKATEEDMVKITAMILQHTKQLESNVNQNVEEIQIDCDWSTKTRDQYFKFLKFLREKSGKKITCTLRLHQVKDKKSTGIPPVEKTYLMCYATSSPLEDLDRNTILDVETLKHYLVNLQDYPLKSDFALPIYSWGIVTNHLGKRKLINALTENDLMHKNFEKIGDHTYRILEDGFYFGMYLSKNFTIKIESVPEKDLLEVQKFIDEKLDYNYQYIYYHLDQNFTQHYPTLFE